MVQLSTDLDALYPAHLARVKSLYAQAALDAGKEGVLIASGSLKTTFLDDHHYPFAVNPHFKAWLPVTDVNDSFILFRADEKPQLLFHQPEDYWHKTPEDPSGYWVEHWHIQPMTNLHDAHNRLGDVRSLSFIGEEVEMAAQWGFDSINDQQILDQLHFDRAYKTPYELACLQLANLNAVKGHAAAEAAFRSGGSEFDIQHAYLAAIGHREQQTPYSGIVALNENCAVLHYQHYEHRRHVDAELHALLIDAGAECHGYAADITRTYAYRDGLFADLIASLDEAQLAIIKDIEIGLNYADLHVKMHWRLAEILKQNGLVDMSAEAMIESNITSTFLPHGLGHFLGLQTHDVAGFQQSRKGENRAAPEDHPHLRLTRTIENNQVFTIEPGLYFIPMLLKKLKQSPHSSAVNWQRIETLLPCGGIRIEDNIAMVDGQTVNLTREAFHEL